tara:strand:- start:1188 stop:1946 length:759 start_codon:yes stop_codon:yes gene_type:complete
MSKGYKENYRKIWMNQFGEIPIDSDGRSYDIHHIDGNKNNNQIQNLIAVSIKEHFDIHYKQGDFEACGAISLRMQNFNFKGYSQSEETKRKISAANKGKIRTEKHKRKMSEARKGKTLSEETKQKMSDFRRGKPSGNKGKNHSEETKKKIAESKKGNQNSLGKKHSEETKQKMSNVHKGKFRSKETKEKMSDSKKGNQNWIGKNHSQETKEKMREAQKGKPLPKIKCPHCNKEGGGSLMKRYHFSNCKTPRI